VSGAISYKFRGGTVIPAGGSLYLSPNVNAFRARTNGPSARQNLYVQGPCSGYLSTRGNSPLILQNGSGSLVSSNSYAAYSAQQFLPGNLAVLRVSDGVESPAVAATPSSSISSALTAPSSIPFPFPPTPPTP